MSKLLNQLVPTLDHVLYKGLCGKICVVGGSEEYSGAPYFCAMSSLLTGADLCRVVTTEACAPVIKGYSPELIVTALLKNPVTDEEIEVVYSDFKKLLDRIDCLVIGPGLGRSDIISQQVSRFIEIAKDLNKPMVIDADGLYVLNQNPGLIKGYKHAILTPNLMEFRRLFAVMECHKTVKYHPKSERDLNSNTSLTLDPVKEDFPYSQHATDVIALSKSLDGVTILSKGEVDVISNGDYICYTYKHGNPRRCGGQGDVLAGAVATFAAWANRSDLVKDPLSISTPLLPLAALSACIVTRYAGRKAFEKYKRSMIAGNLLEFIGQSMEKFYPLK